MTPLDRHLLLWINGLVGSSVGLFEAALLLCGPLPLVACVATLLALWWRDPEAASGGPILPLGAPPVSGARELSRRRCVALAGGVALSFICTRLIAYAGDWSRPLGREDLAVPIEPERWGHLVSGMTGFGAFPSDHAALFAALAVGLFGWSVRAGVAGLLVAGVFSLARVAVGFHYPSDMVAGAAIGAALGGAALALARRPQPILDGVVALFRRHPAWMYPLLFVVALDFTQHFRLVFRAVFFFLLSLLGGR
jgi:undecaprenyl-diphosphatase